MPTQPLTAREVCQVLRDIALAVRTMRRVGDQLHCAPITVEADGWVITLYVDGDTLDYCDSCCSPDGRAYRFDALQRYGTDPVELLSTWEHAQLVTLLNGLSS